jgi:endonuclease/exonuclease/phosphatase (EEP) superfamily protein YafD
VTATGQTPHAGGAWDSPGPAPRRGVVALVLPALLILPFGLMATALRVFPPSDGAPALAASFVAYGTLAYAGSLLGFGIAALLARRKVVLAVLSMVTAAFLALHVWWLLPLFVPDDRPATTPTFTVLSLNIRNGLADPAGIVARARNADIVVLLETTPSAIRALRDAGLDGEFAYRAGGDGTDSASAIYSRDPLTAIQPLPQTSFQMWQATAEVPGVGPVRVIAAHPCNPFCGPGYWPSEHALLQRVIAEDLNQPLVVAGDFNAVDDHRPMRDLYALGLTSAADIVGAGWLPTYPANLAIPPLIPIDHILVDRQLTATSVARVAVGGTDHLGLIATLAGTS